MNDEASSYAMDIVELHKAYLSLTDGATSVEVDGAIYLNPDEVVERAQSLCLSMGPVTRNDWAIVGSVPVNIEYAILLGTGGPACRVRGPLGMGGRPEGGWLEIADYGMGWERPWIDLDGLGEALQWFVGLFYYGEDGP